MAKVTLENVSKRLGQVEAVSRVHLGVEDKEFLVLLGPSGCGKSTTLRMIAGLEELTEGNIYIGDKLVNNMPPKYLEFRIFWTANAGRRSTAGCGQRSTQPNGPGRFQDPGRI